MDPEEYVEAVLSLVELVPRGRVTTYGGSVPWWRVVRADGSLPPSHDEEARAHYLEEGTPFRTPGRVDMPRAAWWPPSAMRG